MIFIVFSAALLVLALLPLTMITRNLPLFQRAPQLENSGSTGTSPLAIENSIEVPGISVLVPARNEQHGIRSTLEAILRSSYPRFEVCVLDDNSSDDTASIVRAIATADSRVALLSSDALPDGWNGKQHACWQLAQRAQFEFLLFLDADVALEPDALGRTLTALHQSQAKLISGFPNQITGSFSERLLIPMMHYVLLGYLPLDRMRSSAEPGFGAGCGQLFLCCRDAYFHSDGHRNIRSSRHDGLKLPRSFRAHGFLTDLFDAADIAQVRMYCGLQEVQRGILKNATEGFANYRLIVLFSVLLLGGSVLPIFSFAHALFYGWPSIDSARLWSTVLLGVATAVSFVPRLLIARKLQQNRLGAWLHPIAVTWFMALQWLAFMRDCLGLQPVPWRGRT